VYNASEDKLSFKPSALRELELYSNYVDRFIDERCDPEDREAIWELFREFPHVGLAVAKNYTMSNDEKIEIFLEAMAKPKLHVIGGGIKGGGKTALSYYVAEELYKRYGKKTCIFKPLNFVPDAVPEYFSVAHDEAGIPAKAFVIYDEAAISMSARRAMKTEHVDFSAYLAVQRHRENSVIVIQQVMAMSDRNIFRLADDFIFKEVGMPQLESGEKGKDPFYLFLKFLKPLSVEENLYFDSAWKIILFFKTPLASFWEEHEKVLSRPLAQIDDFEAMEYIKREAPHRKLKDIQKMLKLKGINWDMDMIKDIIESHSDKKTVEKSKSDMTVCKHCGSCNTCGHGRRGGKIRRYCDDCGKTSSFPEQ
jgi:hypothetical protein